MARITLIIAVLVLLFPLSQVSASDSPQEQRHELMEKSKNAAKPVGGMLKGEVSFDADTAMESFQTWDAIARKIGDLFPEGSETGHDTEAKATIWTDRDGFNKEIATFAAAVEAAIAADPQSLEDLKAAAGPVFKSCKSCHEGYRVED